MRELLAATGNRFKLAELRQIAERYNCRIVSPSEWQERYDLPPIPQVDEDQDSYLGNATLKADAFAKWGKCTAVADDSGLEVDTLGGRPGVLSARYGGTSLNDRERCDLLLKEMLGMANRRARYRCSLVASAWDPASSKLEPQRHVAHSELGGVITAELRGLGCHEHSAFGYNPVVLIDRFGATLAEVEFERICSEGFRAEAAKMLFEQLFSTIS